MLCWGLIEDRLDYFVIVGCLEHFRGPQERAASGRVPAKQAMRGALSQRPPRYIIFYKTLLSQLFLHTWNESSFAQKHCFHSLSFLVLPLILLSDLCFWMTASVVAQLLLLNDPAAKSSSLSCLRHIDWLLWEGMRCHQLSITDSLQGPARRERMGWESEKPLCEYQ